MRSFEIENGILKKYNGTQKHVVIPEGVTDIGDRAFAWNKNLTNVTIPAHVKNIGNYAFIGCKSLTSVELPGNVTNIGSYAFSGCQSLASIEIPGNVTNIGSCAFSGCQSLASVVISNGVTSIDYGAFSGCQSLTSIVLPDSVTKIGGTAFMDCYSLASVVLPKYVADIGTRVFYGTPWLHSQKECLVIGDVLVIGAYAQSHVVIPQGVRKIEADAFVMCGKLQSIVIPNSVTHIGSSAFMGCRNLTSVTIPNSVTHIGSSAFSTCNNLSTVILPDSVTSLGHHVFSGCISLTNLTLPNSINDIGHAAFSGCNHMTSIQLSNSLTDIKSETFSKCRNLISITIPDGVTRIDNYAFADCKDLTSVICSEKTTEIASDAFEKCDSLQLIQAPGIPLSAVDNNMKSLLLNGFISNMSVYSEDRKAEYLKYMNGRKKVQLQQAVLQNNVSVLATHEKFGIKLSPSLRDELIELASAEEKVEVLTWLLDYKNRTADLAREESNKARVAEQQLQNPYMPKFLRGDWSWSTREDGTIRIDQYKGKDAEVTIPPFVGNTPVTAIGDHLFKPKHTKVVQKIAIPNSVNTIEDWAFNECSALQDVSFFSNPIISNDGLQDDSAGHAPIEASSELITIGQYAFARCWKLKTFVVPKNVTQIGEGAFYLCGSLESISLPSRLRILKRWHLPEGVQIIRRPSKG